MNHAAVTRSLASSAGAAGIGPSVPVNVTLLGVRVTAYSIINMVEHRRREEAGLGAVINPALLDRLLDLPTGVPVADPVTWAEMSDQLPAVLGRSDDDLRLTRHLVSPLSITDVVINAAAGKELRAVQEASLFAGFTR